MKQECSHSLQDTARPQRPVFLEPSPGSPGLSNTCPAFWPLLYSIHIWSSLPPMGECPDLPTRPDSNATPNVTQMG